VPSKRALVLVAAAALAPACARTRAPVDLLSDASAPAEAAAGRLSRAHVIEKPGRALRLHDVTRRVLLASPPSLYRFAVQIPQDARLSFACGITERSEDGPPVEFRISLRRGSQQETLYSQVLDPRSRREHRGWVPALVELGRFAGKHAELILETRGEREGVKRAYWGSPALTSPRHEAPLVVLYLVDTLRADHTGPYGYGRDTTPALSAFARDAVVFESAIAQASWTKPSVASIFTSQLAGQHRVVQLRDRLNEAATTLAEMLQAKGYATGAAIANSVIYLKGGNFEQGFDYFAGLHGPSGPSKLVDAAPVVDAALSWIDARAGFPTFVYVHTMDPHVPYAPPPPFDRKFEPAPLPGRAATDPRTDYAEAADRERLIAQYDGDVAYGDREFGRFVAALKARGLYDRALFIFTADHGEEFLDHGQWLHGRSVFDELIRVPLLVKLPGGQHSGKRVAQQVRTVDLLPTILEAVGLPVPQPPAIAGRPLQAVIEGRAPEPVAVAEISHRGFVAHAARTRLDKYVQRFSPEHGELYFDLAADPKEARSVLEANPERVRALKAEVETAMAPNPFRHVVRASGGGVFDLVLLTRGWIADVDASALGAGESQALMENGRRLVLRLRPRPGRSREISFVVRPRGAPVFLEGRRDGRPLRPADLAFAGGNPAGVPARLPEPESDQENAMTDDVFAPPPGSSGGVQVWLSPTPGAARIEIDHETCERMKALGYVATCGGQR
jgi:arylsulfatase A-like enzyme